MGKKLSNKEWEDHINEYYSKDTSISVVKFCEENNLSKQQFHYHKKRISESKAADATVFQGFKMKTKENNSNKDVVNSEVKIIIGNATIAIPVSETTLISSIIKELAI